MSTGFCESPNRKYGLRDPAGSCAGSWIATASEKSAPGAAAAAAPSPSLKKSSALDSPEGLPAGGAGGGGGLLLAEEATLSRGGRRGRLALVFLGRHGQVGGVVPPGIGPHVVPGDEEADVARVVDRPHRHAVGGGVEGPAGLGDLADDREVRRAGG